MYACFSLVSTVFSSYFFTAFLFYYNKILFKNNPTTPFLQHKAAAFPCRGRAAALFGYGEKWRRSQSLSAESSGIHRHHLVAGGGDLVGRHAGVVQGKLCQRGKICRVHLVQLRKVCGNAHPCTELTDKLDHCRCGSVRGKSALQAHGSGR